MLSLRNYFNIFILMLTMFIVFMMVGVTNNSNHIKNNIDNNIRYNNETTEVFLDIDNIKDDNLKNKLGNKLLVAIIDSNKNSIRVFKEYCIYNKYLYKTFNYFPDKEEIKGFGLILFGDMDFKANIDTLYDYSNLGITMMFINLEYQDLVDNKRIANFFGIDKIINKEIQVDGFEIYKNFMIANGRTYTENDFYGNEDDTHLTIPYYSLLPGTEVYCVGLFNDLEKTDINYLDLPPLLWRATTNNAFVFVVNHEIFQESSLLGILTGFKSREKNFHIYPIINGNSISVINFPYLSNENNDVIKNIYGRSSQALTRDLLWPNIIQILYKYGNSKSFFLALELDYLDDIEPINYLLDFYLTQISKLPGDVGISFSQKSNANILDVINKNEKFFKENLPEYNFRSTYLADFKYNDFMAHQGKGLLKNISLALSDYNKDTNLFNLMNNGVLSLKYNLDGFRHETVDDLRMISIENALGLCNVKVDMSKVYYPGELSAEWNDLSLRWSKGKTYFNDFKVFDFVSIEELEKRIRRFIQLDFAYEYKNESLEVFIDNFDEEAYFIFSIYDKDILRVVNAEASEITENTYLLKALKNNINIQFKDKSSIGPPRNGKIIPNRRQGCIN